MFPAAGALALVVALAGCSRDVADPRSAMITPGVWSDASTLTYNQVVPKPFCNATGDRGAQILMTKLRVGTYGTDSYRAEEKCLGPEGSGRPTP